MSNIAAERPGQGRMRPWSPALGRGVGGNKYGTLELRCQPTLSRLRQKEASPSAGVAGGSGEIGGAAAAIARAAEILELASGAICAEATNLLLFYGPNIFNPRPSSIGWSSEPAV